ncbi:alpha/beta hydrolase fold domain-containing protein [Planctomycetes bacterium CA13]
MHHTKIGFLIVTLVATSAFGQQTQTETPRQPIAVPLTQRPRITFEEILRREDANKDGKVTKDEFKGPPRLFQRFDLDRDDVLTQLDFAASVRQSRMGRQRNFAAAGDVAIERDLVFGKGGQRDLTMHLVLPKNRSDAPAPVYVWIHGGGWQGGTKDGGIRQVTPLVKNGFVGATIEYRLTGEASFPAQIQDCKCAIRFLRAHALKYNIDPERIAVGGSSAGGHLAALVGTSGDVPELEGNGGWPDQSSRVQAVVDLYGPTDFNKFVVTNGFESHNKDGSPESKLLGGGRVLDKPDGIKRVNPITYVDKEDPPFLILHGKSDRTVPPNQSEAMHKALQAANVPTTLHIIEGAGHGGPEFSKPDIRKKQTNFILSVLGEEVAVPK